MVSCTSAAWSQIIMCIVRHGMAQLNHCLLEQRQTLSLDRAWELAENVYLPRVNEDACQQDHDLVQRARQVAHWQPICAASSIGKAVQHSVQVQPVLKLIGHVPCCVEQAEDFVGARIVGDVIFMFHKLLAGVKLLMHYHRSSVGSFRKSAILAHSGPEKFERQQVPLRKVACSLDHCLLEHR